MARLVPIHILGTSFSLKTEENAEDLTKTIDFFQSRVDETLKKVPLQDPLKVAIVTGIVLCDELMKERQRVGGVLSDKDADELESITRLLIEKIDFSLNN